MMRTTAPTAEPHLTYQIVGFNVASKGPDGVFDMWQQMFKQRHVASGRCKGAEELHLGLQTMGDLSWFQVQQALSASRYKQEEELRAQGNAGDSVGQSRASQRIK
jgi:hypothetical protein